MMTSEADNASPHVLIVTGPARDRLYVRFSALFSGREGVQVVKDRRVAERRRAAAGLGNGERRSGDRRRERPDWVFPPA